MPPETLKLSTASRLFYLTTYLTFFHSVSIHTHPFPPLSHVLSLMTARIQSPMHCVHCNTTETPLWRAGPAGPKTLCNACGVRWKKTGSVIPRAKRPAHVAASNNGRNELQVDVRNSNKANGASNSTNGQNLRKRARTAASTSPQGVSNGTWPDLNGNHSGVAQSSQRTSHAGERRERKPLDAAARVAAASLPAPRPISTFRVSDVQRSKYECVFTGLMAVNRRQSEGEESRSMRSRTQTAKASAYFSDLPGSSNGNGGKNCGGGGGGGGGSGNHGGLVTMSGSDDVITPSPSPPPIDLSLAQSSVYVTEVLAPSPSPSPPPMPKVQRMPGGASFKLVVTTVAEEKNMQPRWTCEQL